MKMLKIVISCIGLAVVFPFACLFYLCEDLWEWAWNDSLPLACCKDPEERKRAHMLILSAGVRTQGADCPQMTQINADD